MYWFATTAADGGLYAENFEIAMGQEATVPLNIMGYEDESYKAIQFDVTLPDGLDINEIIRGEQLNEHEFVISQMDMNSYRIVAYTIDNSEFCTGNETVASFNVSAFSVIEEADRQIGISNIYAVNSDNDEVRMENVKISFAESTGIDSNLATIGVSGGELITVTVLEPQEVTVYSVDGRLVRKMSAKVGTTKITVPSGIYIVNGEKVTVY